MLSAAVGIGRVKPPYRGTVNRQAQAGPPNKHQKIIARVPNVATAITDNNRDLVLSASAHV
ncbi:unnamed protein product [Prunus armeniaca]|uniref:Uncharacterized protein n=1 Tax=Prunus armeniaca TaxID=36596 RepID=A0A6J5UM92_PRUAR|nr:hypothetical protein GBA52_013354 [Prunus armeniaca]CAB4276887.1 unnamed protein product [Prunus armeniaca]CAB4307282.1 unnamed protein product [Prunus armeniaca]